MIPILVLLTLGVPAGAVVALWRRRPQNAGDWVFGTAIGWALLFIVFSAAPWVLVSYYLRYVVVAVALVATAVSCKHIQRGTPGPTPRGRLRRVARPVELLALLVLAAAAVRAHFHGGPTVELDFPLRRGTYVVLQGGNSPLTNPFHYWSAGRLALDVVKLGPLGNRASGIAPGELGEYLVFGDTVYSPCTGDVIESVADLPDKPPGLTDPEHPPGNHVTISCEGANVLLAHLREGSVTVARGECVTSGQVVGVVGNSGNTIEPHLHIEATSPVGSALPLSFQGRFLTANSVIRSAGLTAGR